MQLRAQCDQTAGVIRSRSPLRPRLALVLGSGLGALADSLSDAVSIPYSELPGFVPSTAPGHAGRMVIGRLQGVEVLCMQGRLHFYEGYSMQQVTYPVRVMKALGIETLVLTNACGGLDPAFQPGDLMLVTDHINYMGQNPLIGPNEDGFGPRFPDMTHVYGPALQQLARDAAAACGVPLREGVYVAFTGPSYETPAEIRMFQKLGAGAVGMSTVPEAIVASHCGLNVMAISCVANLAAGMLDVPLSGEEVVEVAGRTGPKFAALLTEIVRRIGAGQ